MTLMPMLDKEIISQLQGIFANLATPFTLVVNGVAGREDTDRMLEFAREFASASPAIDVRANDTETIQKAPVMELWRDGAPTGVSFCGIPTGYEFTSLILAVLNAAGMGKNMPDEALARRIKALQD